MKDEIKEILEFDFQSQGERIEINEYERDILKDYITNLQHNLWEEQELSELFKDKYERMKENAEILSKGYNDLEKENEVLNAQIDAMSTLSKKDYKEIYEYLERFRDGKVYFELPDTIKGEDKDVKD